MGPKAKGEKVLKIKNSYNKLMKTMMTNINKKHFMQAVTAAVNLENEFKEYKKLYPENEVIPTIIGKINKVGNILNDYDTTLMNVETNPTMANKESDLLKDITLKQVKEVFESFNNILEGNTDMVQVQQKMHEEAERRRAADKQRQNSRRGVRMRKCVVQLRSRSRSRRQNRSRMQHRSRWSSSRRPLVPKGQT